MTSDEMIYEMGKTVEAFLNERRRWEKTVNNKKKMAGVPMARRIHLKKAQIRTASAYLKKATAQILAAQD